MMNKKKNDMTSEDSEIKKVAYKNSSQIILLIILITLFTLTFFCTLFYIGQYYDAKINIKNVDNTMEIKTKYNNILITNNGRLNKTIDENDTKYNKEILIEKNAKIKFITKKDAKESGKININVKYNIENNEFNNKAIASNNNDVLVRFKYSYDNENWKYINNVISTTDSTLSPLMGSYYDISGLVTNLKVATNLEINNKIGNVTTMYWECETLLKNVSNNIGKNIKAEFKIEYNDND